jgi:hypothetical protein
MPAGQYNGWMPNNNNWQWNQPYQQQQQLNNRNSINNIFRVTGPESAKAYPLCRDSSVVLFDADNPVFYLKTTDDGGFPLPLRTFSFEEIKTPEVQPVVEQIDTSNFVTKDDLEGLQNNISELKNMLEGLVN